MSPKFPNRILIRDAVFSMSNQLKSILKSSSNYSQYEIFHWGLSDDVPVPGDYDGKYDVAQYRPSNGNWFILNSRK